MNVLVTAGPTREAIDPVRYVSNRSSGKMGYAIAAAAAARGHAVCLVSGPVCLEPPAGVAFVPVVSADDMLAAVGAQFGACDALVMAAAVADFRPRAVSPVKLKKAAGLRPLELEATPDILAAVAARKGTRFVAGFAAETGPVMLAEARRKLRDKNLDLIVANDVSEPGAGFEVDTNRVTFVDAAGEEALPLMSKAAVADRLVRRIEAELARRAP